MKRSPTIAIVLALILSLILVAPASANQV